MREPPVEEATAVLHTLSSGDASAADRLLKLVYADLRALAASFFRSQPADHTLQPTALVHEAYLRLIDATGASFESRAHFFAVAAKAMRQILINHARGRAALKRGGDRRRVSLDNPQIAGAMDMDLLALDEALERLESIHDRKARVVEMRFFGGMTIEEIGSVLGVSTTTVDEDWALARAWLSRALREED